MPPSSTVENYLKEVYLGVNRLPPDALLLPMGQLASARAKADADQNTYERLKAAAATPGDQAGPRGGGGRARRTARTSRVGGGAQGRRSWGSHA